MPVFLNRHDFLKVTAADIAQIHLDELKIQQEFGCWVVAYWFDQKRKTTFCLIDAPDLEAVKEMQYQVHLSYPGEIVEIEGDVIETFLSNIEYPKGSARKSTPQSLVFEKQVFSAVLVMKFFCVDPFFLKESTKKKRFPGDFKDSSQKLVKKNNGRIVKSACDCCIYTFESVYQCLKFAIQIQQELSVQINKNGETLKVGYGIDGRMTMKEHCTPLEEAANLASRLCCIAANNQILISSSVEEQIQLEELEALVENSNLKSLPYRDEQFLIRLMDIIEVHYREDLKIGDFCKIMGESRSQLYRKIIEVTNLPPIELINEFRLKKAIELMNTQNGSNISQIAFEAGFNSLSYFSRRFKKRYGLLPSAYMHRIS